jgi:hypothetical protein
MNTVDPQRLNAPGFNPWTVTRHLLVSTLRFHKRVPRVTLPRGIDRLGAGYYKRLARTLTHLKAMVAAYRWGAVDNPNPVVTHSSKPPGTRINP